ncbi:hypothetical protein HK100_000241 [Physocladia obscura]|uniref:Uncharacterized protein n=1 Tax=Physocladia obscura TaxID=109957 RepID=A0AAD5XFC4_9FUNG|nr:hypothetical protein HK100_000241 [Physocladia obscura]
MEENVLRLLEKQFPRSLALDSTYRNISVPPTTASPAVDRRRAKAALLVVLLCISRKKLRACAANAETFLDSVIETEPDALIRTLAHLVRPFVSLTNPGINIALDTITTSTSSIFSDALDTLTATLDKMTINCNPPVFRYLAPSVTDAILNPPNTPTRVTPFKIQNTWVLAESSAPAIITTTENNNADLTASLISDSAHSAYIMACSNSALFGAQMNFKPGEELVDLVKERAIRRKFWANYSGSVKAATPVSATVPNLTSATVTSSANPGSAPTAVMNGAVLPPRKYSASSALDFSGSVKRTKTTTNPLSQKRSNASFSSSAVAGGAKKIGAGLQTTTKIRMLEVDYIAKEERAKFEQKKKAEDDANNEAARKKREQEEKRQQARDSKERELEEKRIKRERAIEDKRNREAEEKTKREAERQKREDMKKRRIDEEKDREEKRRRRSVETPETVRAPSPPKIRGNIQDPSTLPPWEQPQQQQQFIFQQQQQPVVVVENTTPTVSAVTVLGADIHQVSQKDREIVEKFLTGHYETKDIKLNEITVRDEATGVMQIHTLYLVLDYEACKWKKVKRKRRI